VPDAVASPMHKHSSCSMLAAWYCNMDIWFIQMTQR